MSTISIQALMLPSLKPIDVVPTGSMQYQTQQMRIETPNAIVWVSKAQAMEFFGLTDPNEST
jgi:hypothetical protein